MKFRLHPLFLVFGFVLVISGLALEFLTYLLVVFFHELGHMLVAKKRGYELKKMYLLPYGVSLSYQNFGIDANDEIAIAVAGPLVNFSLCIITLSLWWIFPITYAFTNVFFLANFVTFIFNLLPAFPLDGGRILVAILQNKIEKKKALKISLIFNIIFSIVFLIIFIISIFFKINFTYLLICIFLLGGILENKYNTNYEKINSIFLSKILLSKGVETTEYTFSSDTNLLQIKKKMNKKHFYFINIIDANNNIITLNNFQLENLFLNYDLYTKIKDLNIIK